MTEMEEVFLTPADINNVQFRVRLFGYDREEVDELLDRIYHDYSALYRQNALLKERIASLERELSRFRQLESEIKDAVVIARETANRLIRTAEEEAKQRYQSKLMELEERQRQLNSMITSLRTQILSLVSLRDRIVDELELSLNKLQSSLATIRERWNKVDERLEMVMAESLPDPRSPLSSPEEALSLPRKAALPSPAGRPTRRRRHNSRRDRGEEEAGLRSDSKA